MVNTFTTVLEMDEFDIESLKCEIKEKNKKLRLPIKHKIIDLRDDLGWIYRGDDEVKKGGSNPIYWIKKVKEKEYRVMLMRAEDIWLYIINEQGMINDLSSGLTKKNHKNEWGDLTGRLVRTHSNYGKELAEKGVICKNKKFYTSPLGKHYNKCVDKRENSGERLTCAIVLKEYIHSIVRKSRYNVYEYPYFMSLLFDYLMSEGSQDKTLSSEYEYDVQNIKEIYKTILEIYKLIWAQIFFINDDVEWIKKNPILKEELWELFQLPQPKGGKSGIVNENHWNLIMLRISNVGVIVQWYLEKLYGKERRIPDDECTFIIHKCLEGGGEVCIYTEFLDRLITDKMLNIENYKRIEEHLKLGKKTANCSDDPIRIEEILRSLKRLIVKLEFEDQMDE